MAESVFLIRPKFGGLANDTQILTIEEKVLYHVKSKPFSPLGRVYLISDSSGKEVLKTEQDHTAMFPRHSIIENGKETGKLGQIGILPQLYYIQYHGIPRRLIHLGGANPVMKLGSDESITAEVEQRRSTWTVRFMTSVNELHMLGALAVISRENTIGG